MTASPRVRDRLPWAIALGFVVLETTSKLVRSGSFDLAALSDFLINMSQSVATLARGTPPEHFYYPPPFVLFYATLGELGTPVAGALWLATVVVGTLLALWLGMKLVALPDDRWRGWLALAALGSVAYFVQWDLRTANSNGIVLALVLASLTLERRGRPIAAGAALSCAIAFKLYPVLLVPYLAWRARWRWLAATAAGLGVLFVVWPVLALGPVGAVELTAGWLAEMFRPVEPGALPDYYKAFSRSMWLALGPAAAVPTRVLQLLWLALVAFHLAHSRRDWGDRREPGATAADLSVLLIAPLLLSPTLQAHHAVVALLPALWLVQRIVDPALSVGLRVAAGVGLVAAPLSIKLVPEWPERALALAFALAVYLVSVVAGAAVQRRWERGDLVAPAPASVLPAGEPSRLP